jgi:hypothetical protein
MKRSVLWVSRVAPLVALSLAFACSKDDRGDDGLFGSSGGAGGDGGADDGGGDEGGDDGDDGGSGGGGDDGGGDDGDDGDGGDGPKFDVGGGNGTGGGNPGDDPNCDPETDPECACTGVDLLFIIDNSVSMNDCQVAIGQAFPTFAEVLVQELPVATSLHVGVTSTEMGHSNSGSTSNCTATGDNGQPSANFYVTPDQQNNGINGAQGRLYEAGGLHYYEVDTDAPQADIDGLSDWFAQAARIGDSGSQIEMSAAPAGWAFHSANDATNAGFARDEGTVLVLFWLQDEPDQTPASATQDIINMITAAKAGCGGMNCTVGGGSVNVGCLPEVPLGTVLDSLGAPAVVENLPDCDSVTADYFKSILADTLAQVIAMKGGEIPPPP